MPTYYSTAAAALATNVLGGRLFSFAALEEAFDLVGERALDVNGKPALYVIPSRCADGYMVGTSRPRVGETEAEHRTMLLAALASIRAQRAHAGETQPLPGMPTPIGQDPARLAALAAAYEAGGAGDDTPDLKKACDAVYSLAPGIKERGSIALLGVLADSILDDDGFREAVGHEFVKAIEDAVLHAHQRMLDTPAAEG